VDFPIAGRSNEHAKPMKRMNTSIENLESPASLSEETVRTISRELTSLTLAKHASNAVPAVPDGYFRRTHDDEVVESDGEEAGDSDSGVDLAYDEPTLPKAERTRHTGLDTTHHDIAVSRDQHWRQEHSSAYHTPPHIEDWRREPSPTPSLPSSPRPPQLFPPRQSRMSSPSSPPTSLLLSPSPSPSSSPLTDFSFDRDVLDDKNKTCLCPTARIPEIDISSNAGTYHLFDEVSHSSGYHTSLPTSSTQATSFKFLVSNPARASFLSICEVSWM
jgi:hypothetical protein